MAQAKIEIAMSEPSGSVRLLKLRGRLDQAAQEPLLAAWQEASSSGVGTVVLNFENVEGMDSVGLGLLIMLAAQARQQKQRFVAWGLSEPLKQAFRVSYLDEVLPVFTNEGEALEHV